MDWPKNRPRKLPKMSVVLEEWNYIYAERISLLAGTEEPTAQEIAMATKDADDAVKRIYQTV